MADKGARTTISVSTCWDDRAIMQAEADRTGQPLNITVMRLAKLGLEHQVRMAAGGVVSQGSTGTAAPEGSVPLLTAAVDAPGSTAVIPAAGPTATVPAPIRQSAPEPAPAAVIMPLRRQTGTPRGAGAEGIASVPLATKAHWSAFGVLSLLLALMLVPGNGFTAAAFSQTMLGYPGDGIAASNQLFERHSHRAGPLRYLEATTRLVDNRARVRACADRADRFADYRRLTTCSLNVPSRRRAIEVGQGIVD